MFRDSADVDALRLRRFKVSTQFPYQCLRDIDLLNRRIGMSAAGRNILPTAEQAAQSLRFLFLEQQFKRTSSTVFLNPLC
jgi:hypothetical protein